MARYEIYRLIMLFQMEGDSTVAADLIAKQSLLHSKGVGKEVGSSAAGSLLWDLLKEDVSLPAAALDIEDVHFNLNWMEEFIGNFNSKILLAPHGKTTMMPSLFKQVVERKSTWGITLATATQVKVAHNFGFKRILMANQLVGRRNMEIISEILEIEPEFEFLCIVDSVEIVTQLGAFFSERNQKLNVLLEYGPPNDGRTGVRNHEQEALILKAIQDRKELCLVGIEFFEGVLSSEDEVTKFIDFVTERVQSLYEAEVFSSSTRPIIISGSGSAWFDVVAASLYNFSNIHKDLSLEIILRPGCYMIHDVALYTKVMSRVMSKQLMKSELKPALKIWSYVQSIPEKNLAILSFGRRDAANDSGFPKPALWYRPTGGRSSGLLPQVVLQSWEITRMMDQHSFMKISDKDDIKVGDMIGLDIAHPCTTLDKWRNVLVVDKEYKVKNVYSTYF